MIDSPSHPIHTLRLHADLLTPVSVYAKLRPMAPWSFLLESVEGPKHWADYSILGFGARRVFEAHGGTLTIHHPGEHGAAADRVVHGSDPLEALRTALRERPWVRTEGVPPFVGGIFGYVAYDAVRFFERIPSRSDDAEVPDAYFFEPELLAVFDNRRHTLTLYSQDERWLGDAETRIAGAMPPHLAAEAWCDPTTLDSRDSYKKAVEDAQELIRAGDIIQVVLSRRFELPRVADPFNVYRGLRTINPSPYLYYIATPQVQISGASPEVMVRVQDGRVIVRPIAGTRPRGANAAHDARLAQELLADPKERAEHIMLVDLGRNDVGRVSKPGSVSVSDLMLIENYSHVMHIVSEVQGTLEEDCDAFDALRAAFPAGTLSGAPKVRAMEIIDALEHRRRGIYGGAVGYFGPRGDADFGIAIRTLVALPDRFVMQAGAGIVADSIPEREADETEHKVQAVIRAARWAASSEAAW